MKFGKEQIIQKTLKVTAKVSFGNDLGAYW